MRICSHMNIDHRDSLFSYAKFYCRVLNPVEVEMVEINSQEMKLKVDGNIMEINFDHSLKSSQDAKETLVSMIMSLPKNS